MIASFFFEPQRLKQARERVVEKHPFPMSALSDEVVMGALPADELVERLLACRTKDQLHALVEGLNRIERAQFSTLVCHDSETIRVRCIRGLLHRTNLVRAQYIWRGFCLFGESVEGRYLTHLLQIPHVLAQLSSTQASMVGATQVSVENIARVFWKHVTEGQERAAEVWREELGIPDGSWLSGVLTEYLMTRGNAKDWRLESRDVFEAALHQKPLVFVLEVLTHAHALFGQPRANPLTHDKILLLVEYLRPRKQELLGQLALYSEAGAQWWKQLLISSEISLFFEQAGDNERFLFWKEYMPLMKDVWGESVNKRLFIDFGGFGVIEFAETGNASYVYPTKIFEKFLKTGLQSRVVNSALKDRELCINRIHHSSRWRPKARRMMRDWLFEYRIEEEV